MKKTWLFLLTLVMLLGSCDNLILNQEEKVDGLNKLREHNAFGWNTWNNSNLLNQVLLPEGLSLRINFRPSVESSSPYFLTESYISEKKDDSHAYIIPVAHSVNGNYTDMKVTWKGLTARIQTATHKDDVYILYTPEIVPENPPVLILEVGSIWNNRGMIQKKEGFIQADFGPKGFNIGSSQPDSTVLLPLQNPYHAMNSAVQTGFYTGRKRTLDFVKRFVAEREQQIIDHKNLYGEYADTYDYLRSALAWNMIYDANNERMLTTSRRSRNARFGGWYLENQDAWFGALLHALEDKYYAFGNAIEISEELSKEGFIPASANQLDINSYKISGGPAGSMIAKLIYDKYPEKWFLKEVYPSLLSWNRWWDKNRNFMGFLSWGSDTYKDLPPLDEKKSAINESGINDSLMFSDVKLNPENKLLEQASVGLMSLYISDCQYLAEISRVLEKDEEADELEQRAQKYAAKLEELWDEEAGIYRDKNLKSNQFSSFITPGNFYPLLTGLISEERVDTMVKNYLLNKDNLPGEYLIPSIYRIDRNNIDPDKSYIDAKMNFLVYLGLSKYNKDKAIQAMCSSSEKLIAKNIAFNSGIYEKYDSSTGIGIPDESGDRCHSSGGLLSLMILMEEGFWDHPATASGKE